MSGGQTPFSTKRSIPNGGVIKPSSMLTTVTMANHIGSNPIDFTTGKKRGTVMSMMETESMKQPMTRITSCMPTRITHGETASSVTHRDHPAAAPEWARIWLNAVELV